MLTITRMLKGAALTPIYYALARSRRVPGIRLRMRLARLALRGILRAGGSRDQSLLIPLLLYPFDSVRYFECDFVWNAIAERGFIGHYLDVSSPRLLPLLLLDHYHDATATLINPDQKDLDVTVRLFNLLGMSERAACRRATIEKCSLPPESFDTITSISVVEHIPEEAIAIESMWRALKPGGSLILTVPCASEGFEEFLDFNEYGVLEKNSDGFVFGQRFYDEHEIARRIFTITGPPRRSLIFGEKQPGSFFSNRSEKISSHDYPFWREPLLVSRDYRRFSSIRELSGIGVIGLEFRKP